MSLQRLFLHTAELGQFAGKTVNDAAVKYRLSVKGSWEVFCRSHDLSLKTNSSVSGISFLVTELPL